jgi:uncharacterized membrane protein
MSLPFVLHVLAAMIWVGGMFFALLSLRPATIILDPPVRLRLWAGVLSRFFRWVAISAGLLLLTGFLMFSEGARGPQVHAMLGIGILMMLLSAHAYFAPYKRLKRLLRTGNWPEATRQLDQLRLLLSINLALGLLVTVLASAGRYGFR